MFVGIVGLILIIVIGFLSLPLWRGGTHFIPMGLDASEDQERIDLEIEKQTLLHSLAELDLDAAQAKFTKADYDRLKAVDERRLITILDRLDKLSKENPISPTEKRQWTQPRSGVLAWTISTVLSVLVIGGTVGIYSFVQSRELAQQVASRQAQAPQGMPNPIEMVARLEKRLQENPNDLDGQIMAGRSYMALQRLNDAKKAWNKSVELDSRNYEAHFNLGVILLQTISRDDKKSLEKAVNHFDIAMVKIPTDPILLWYRGVALVHLNRFSEADESWTTAFQNLMPGTEDAEFVKKALENLRAGKPPQF